MNESPSFSLNLTLAVHQQTIAVSNIFDINKGYFCLSPVTLHQKISASPTSPLWLTILFSECMIVLTELTLEAVDLAAKIINTSIMRRLDEGHDNVDCDDWSMS